MPDQGSPAIEFRDVSFRRPGGPVVLDRFNLRVETGEVLALVGRSGAGKTTILKLVNRLLLPDSGAVMVEGRDTRDWEPIRLRRRVGYVLQDVGLFPHMSVADNVSVAPRLEGWPGDRIEARVHELLELVGLAPQQFETRWPDELSGGQRQRAWIAMAVAQETPVLLLDEPTTYLDLAHQIDVLDLVVDLNRGEGRTVVMVLHDLPQACRYADHVIAMKAGRIVASGAPSDVITEELVDEVFDVRCQITPDPVSGTPMVIPISRHHPAPVHQS